jgi:class 3 adenylate cyclase
MNSVRMIKMLEKAKGRSEFAIAVFIDIRGFSAFSTSHDSIETAIFVKRFFQIVIDKYFNEANYFKPTGDGLLVIYNYTEEDLRDISSKVIRSCLKLIEEYSSLFIDDEMVNFPVPEKIGIGISRGTVCCLHAKNEIIDYSGKVLNLAARLMDIARPSGIVIDGQYKVKAIPEDVHEFFEEENVYIRGIYEENPIPILYLKGKTQVEERYKFPIKEEILEDDEAKIILSKLQQLEGSYSVNLKREAKEATIKVSIIFPHPKFEGLTRTFSLSNGFGYEKLAKNYKVNIQISAILDRIKNEGINPETEIILHVEYIPKIK